MDTGGPADGTDRAVEIQVNLREVKPYRFTYGGFYDTDRGTGGILEFSRLNLWGAARQLGFHGRYDGDVQEARGFFGQPFLRGYSIQNLGDGVSEARAQPDIHQRSHRFFAAAGRTAPATT